MCVRVSEVTFSQHRATKQTIKKPTSSYVSSDTLANPYSAVFEQVLMDSLAGRLA